MDEVLFNHYLDAHNETFFETSELILMEAYYTTGNFYYGSLTTGKNGTLTLQIRENASLLLSGLPNMPTPTASILAIDISKADTAGQIVTDFSLSA